MDSTTKYFPSIHTMSLVEKQGWVTFVRYAMIDSSSLIGGKALHKSWVWPIHKLLEHLLPERLREPLGEQPLLLYVLLHGR
ncbi:hypothetical protein NHX12_005796 [Muraenolepis orangiensis]|uniref:Uncharacterized protein n=1 Tax=Muraenolepis orangiensis TaxID=630683 RepID=A0A9Q0DTJ6_9TELE|nr:hypothetical protein NHX12_005796 [Muraenolepis orangiensis]